MLRSAARAILSLLLALSLTFSLWSGWQLAQGWPGSAFVAAGAARIEAALNRDLARAAGDGRMTARLAALLDAAPRNWLAIEAVEEEMARQGLAPPPELAARRDAAYQADHGVIATGKACAACGWDARNCSLEIVLICGLPVYLTPLPDLAGVLREGTHYATGQEVDEVDFALSAIGLTAVALVPLTWGSSALVKAGAGVARLARRMGHLPEGVARVFARAASDGFDWAGIARVRSADELAALARPARLRPALEVLEDGGRMSSALGVPATLHLLAHAEDAGELRRLAHVAEAAPNRSVAAFEVLGKSRLLRVARHLSRAAIRFAAALAVTLLALASMMGHALGNALLREVRRRARG